MIQNGHNGICRLTGHEGKFVKSHLLPEALTRTSDSPGPFVEAGQERRPKRKWTSWYDRNLVTEVGENILSGYDSKGVALLRKHQLVWSGWGPMLRLSTSQLETLGILSWSIRKVQKIDVGSLRLFLLSILWRAAESELDGFGEIDIQESELSILREMVRTGSATPLNHFPVSLIQLSTIGQHHNNSPVKASKTYPDVGDGPETTESFFRFYFDGLIAHFGTHCHDDNLVKRLGKMAVGSETELILMAVDYEDSFQRDNIEMIMLEANHQWPGDVERLLG